MSAAGLDALTVKGGAEGRRLRFVTVLSARASKYTYCRGVRTLTFKSRQASAIHIWPLCVSVAEPDNSSGSLLG